MQQTAFRSSMRKYAHRTGSRFYRAGLEDALGGRRKEERCAPSFKIVVKIDEESQSGVNCRIGIIDVGRRRGGFECRGGPGAVNLK